VIVGFQDVGRFDVPVDNSLSEEILHPLDNLGNDGNGLFLHQFAMPGEVLHEVSFRAELGDKEIVLGIFVHTFKPDGIWMLQFL